MVILAYNIGLGAFSTSTVRRLHNIGDFTGAANAFLLFDKYHKNGVGPLVVCQGLLNRRKFESTLYATPVDAVSSSDRLSPPAIAVQTPTPQSVQAAKPPFHANWILLAREGWSAMKVGKQLANPAGWVDVQTTTNKIAALLASALAALNSFGVNLPITSEQEMAVAGFVAAGLLMYNNFTHTATTKQRGLQAGDGDPDYKQIDPSTIMGGST